MNEFLILKSFKYFVKQGTCNKFKLEVKLVNIKLDILIKSSEMKYH